MTDEAVGSVTDVNVDVVCQDQDANCHPSKCAWVFGKTIETCKNDEVDIDSITGVVAKIPVVLAELKVQINVSSFIKLPYPAIEIKDIKKRLKIVQCRLLQNTNMLFIKGFIRKNIDYSTKECSNYKSVCGYIKHCTVDVPFECTTPVTFNGTEPAEIEFNKRKEFEYFKEQELPNYYPEKEQLLAGDLSEFNQISKEYFNELPYCELIKSKIVEFDEYIKREPIDGKAPFEEKEFEKIEEKMVIYLTLKILQKRQVKIC